MTTTNAAEKKRAKRKRMTAALIFLTAFFIRLVYLYQYKSNPFFDSPVIDALSHYLWGIRLSGGDWLARGVVAPRAPLYVYFLAVIFKILGTGYTAARVVQLFLGAVNCVLLYKLGKKAFNRSAGIVSGAIGAVYGPFIYFDAEFLSVTLTIFLNLLLLISLLQTMDRPRLWKWLGCGILYGLSLQTSANLILFLPLVLAWIYIFSPAKTDGADKNAAPLKDNRAPNIPEAQDAAPDAAVPPEHKITRPRARGYLPAFIFGIALIVLPFAVRNYLMGGEFMLISSTAGINFFIGNNPEADGKSAFAPTRDFSYGGWEDNVLISSVKTAQRLSGTKLTPAQVSRFWILRTIEGIIADPLHFYGLLARKFYYFFNAYEIPENQSVYFFRLWASLLRITVFCGRFFCFPFGIIAPLALAGIALFLRLEKRIMLLIFFLGAHLALLTLFFVCSRYRMPVVPVFIVFAAAACVWTLTALRQKQWKAVCAALAPFSLVFLFCNSNLFGVRDDDNSRWFFNLGTALRYKGSREGALKAFQQAENLRPGNPDISYNIGVLHLERNEYEQAIRRFGEVLAMDSADAAALVNMGIALLRTKQYQEAAAVFNKALELDPEDSAAAVNLGAAYFEQNDLPAALGILREAAKTHTASAPVHYYLAMVYERRGQYQQAEQAYLKAVALRRDYAAARFGLANLYEKMGLKAKAEEMRSQAVSLLPELTGK